MVFDSPVLSFTLFFCVQFLLYKGILSSIGQNNLVVKYSFLILQEIN